MLEFSGNLDGEKMENDVREENRKIYIIKKSFFLRFPPRERKHIKWMEKLIKINILKIWN